MENILKKMAKQLDEIDEESLTGLWDKYARIVDDFEPTDRWQEAVLILSFIQAKIWKNQLFNQQWTAHRKLHGRQGEVAPLFNLNLVDNSAKKSKPAVSISFDNEDIGKKDNSDS